MTAHGFSRGEGIVLRLALERPGTPSAFRRREPAWRGGRPQLERLVRRGYLVRWADGRYALGDAGRWLARVAPFAFGFLGVRP